MRLGLGLLITAGLPACLARHSDVPVNLLLHHASHLVEGHHGKLLSLRPNTWTCLTPTASISVRICHCRRVRPIQDICTVCRCKLLRESESWGTNVLQRRHLSHKEPECYILLGPEEEWPSRVSMSDVAVPRLLADGCKADNRTSFLPSFTPRNIGHVSIDHDLGAIVVSLRGTKFWEWFYNLRWLRTAWESTVCVGCQVHIGFDALATYVRPFVTDAVRDILQTEPAKGYDIVVGTDLRNFFSPESRRPSLLGVMRRIHSSQADFASFSLPIAGRCAWESSD